MTTTFDRRKFLVRSAGAAAGMFATGLDFKRQAAFAAGIPVDTIFTNARIWTGEGRRVFTDAIGIIDGRIAALGLEAANSLASARTRRINLEGALVTPGFTDCHVHFTLASATLGQPSLRDAADKAEFTRRIAEAARAMMPGQWLQGGNWDNDRWGGELPTRDWIDAVTPNTPVAVVRYDLHMVLLNSAALKAIGIDDGIADVPGGVVGRDARGRLTGIFKDAAKDLVVGRIPTPRDAEIDAANRKGIALGISKGVTQVHEPGVSWETFHSARRMRAAGGLDMRFYAMTPLKDWEKLAAVVAEEGRGDEFVRWGGCKVVFDGSLGSRTALFYKPYFDDPATHGITVTDEADMRNWAIQADKAGFQISAHAIGDEANDIVLDMLAATARTNGPRDRRSRIEHAQHLAPSAIGRFAEQNVIASVQPFHAIDDGRWALRRIGEKRLETTYAFESLIASGAHVCFGSDWPVAPLDPLTGLKAAVLRETLDGANPDGWFPKQRVEIHDALLSYTRNAAYAGGSEADTGTLAPGRLADFVVWDEDLTTVDPDRLDQAKVMGTWLGGRKVFG
ncbi:amidohydrolase [Novosphingobium album (ex Hu et al. 2023)]|uniref:Amidohydrolase n=1 Tax=Novosphingobium album (ex Hu et al. 2023) TaxID=2930093 RepID=A0ABT0B025_9SPHN|nr:amidohydrolase [Novosphingobium album (ex Hu et al. 2023)]MCJ2178399.1 amidohydrolase [Novosphingobium album (ex Hu et al. 2023)]